MLLDKIFKPNTLLWFIRVILLLLIKEPNVNSLVKKQ